MKRGHCFYRYSTAVMDCSFSTLHSGLHFARIHGSPLSTVDHYVTFHEPYLLFRLDRGLRQNTVHGVSSLDGLN